MKNTTIFEFVNGVKGYKFICIVSNTDVKLKKGTMLRGRVTKVSKQQFGFGASYESAVNNHLQKQGDDRTFVSGELPFGKWYIENRVIEHNGEFYLRVYQIEGKHAESTYLVDGRIATESEVAEINQFKYASSNYSGAQGAAGLTERQVMPRAFKFSSIVEIHYDDNVFNDETKVV